MTERGAGMTGKDMGNDRKDKKGEERDIDIPLILW